MAALLVLKGYGGMRRGNMRYAKKVKIVITNGGKLSSAGIPIDMAETQT